MPTRNTDIARIFEEMSDLLEIADANPFRVRAYCTAAETVQALGRDLDAMVTRNADLSRLPAIGKDLAEKIGPSRPVAVGRWRNCIRMCPPV